MANNENTEHYLTIGDLSRYLQITKGTLYKYTSKKKIPYFKIGKRVRFSKETIDKWVKKLEEKSRKKRRKHR